jgi:hypothetical protein
MTLSALCEEAAKATPCKTQRCTGPELIKLEFLADAAGKVGIATVRGYGLGFRQHTIHRRRRRRRRGEESGHSLDSTLVTS